MTRGGAWLVAALACAACTGDPPSRWLVVDEPLTFCASAPHSQPMALVQATQWRLTIPAGETRLPHAMPLPDRSIRNGEYSPLDLAIDIRDHESASPLGQAELTVAVFEHANNWTLEDDERDALFARLDVDSPIGTSDPWAFAFAVDTEMGTSFGFGTDDSGSDAAMRSMWFGCSTDVRRGPCPNRSFEACDPGGPTTRTHVTFDRGEAALDLRFLEIPSGGGPPHVMFVAAELRIDGVEVIQHDYYALLVSSASREAREATYGVLAPDQLGPAGLGCGVVFAELGTASQRAFTVDCDVQELEPLQVVEVTREVLP